MHEHFPNVRALSFVSMAHFSEESAYPDTSSRGRDRIRQNREAHARPPVSAWASLEDFIHHQLMVGLEFRVWQKTRNFREFQAGIGLTVDADRRTRALALRHFAYVDQGFEKPSIVIADKSERGHISLSIAFDSSPQSGIDPLLPTRTAGFVDFENVWIEPEGNADLGLVLFRATAAPRSSRGIRKRLPEHKRRLVRYRSFRQ
jgi:hypothetical protein